MLNIKLRSSIVDSVEYKEPLSAKSTLLDSTTAGEFRFVKNEFKKTRTYKPGMNGLQPVNWIGNVCPGMPIKELYTVNTKDKKDAPAAKYNFTDTLRAVDVYQHGEISYAAIGDTETIKSLVMISPQLSVGNLRTGMTVAEVLKRYPDVTFNVIGWYEYANISKKNIQLEFLTDKKNRVGTYSQDRKSTKIIRNFNARIDRIRVM